MVQDDPRNWDRVVEAHAERVFRVAHRILGSVQDAEDASQDVFLEALRLHREGSVRNWTGMLVRLATLRAIDRLRRRSPAEQLREGHRISTVEPFEEVAAAELTQWLRNSLVQMPARQAAVFAMFHFEQLSREEIAENLEISPEAVSTALYKSRQHLQARLAVFQGDLK